MTKHRREAHCCSEPLDGEARALVSDVAVHVPSDRDEGVPE